MGTKAEDTLLLNTATAEAIAVLRKESVLDIPGSLTHNPAEDGVAAMIVKQLIADGTLNEGGYVRRKAIERKVEGLKAATDPRRTWGSPALAPARKSAPASATDEMAARTTSNAYVPPSRADQIAELERLQALLNVKFVDHTDAQLFGSDAGAEKFTWKPGVYDMNSESGRNALVPMTKADLAKRVRDGIERLKHPLAGADLAAPRTRK